MEWQCWSCRMCLPLAGYDDSKPNTVNSDQQKLCITQGFWRTCLACKANPSESHTSRSVDADSRQRRTCQGFCDLSRDQSHFTEGAAKCNSCRLWESLQWGMCTECNSIKKYSLMGRIDLNRPVLSLCTTVAAGQVYSVSARATGSRIPRNSHNAATTVPSSMQRLSTMYRLRHFLREREIHGK